MKKKLLTVLAIVLGVIILFNGAYIIGSGFTKITSYISDYTVSDDGTEMTIKVGVISSIGYVRKVAAHQGEDGRLYLDCYSAFGGINGLIGAKSEYVIELPADVNSIWINRYDGYDEILVKDADGSWQRA